MSFVGKAIGAIGDVVGAVSGIAGGLGGVAGAGEQSKAYQAAQNMMAGQKERFEPYSQGGLAGFDQFQQAVLGDSIQGYENFMQRPDIQYQIQEGLGTATQSLANRGMLNSGRGLQELQQVGQQAAGQGYQQYLGNLGALSDYGIQGLSSQSGLTTNMANARIGVGNARGARSQGIGDIVGSEGLGSLIGTVGGWF